MVARLALTWAMAVSTQLSEIPKVGVVVAHPVMSSPPMSMVTKATWPGWLLRKASAAASWLPCWYGQCPPERNVEVVSPEQPRSTSWRPGIVARKWAARSSTYPSPSGAPKPVASESPSAR